MAGVEADRGWHRLRALGRPDRAGPGRAHDAPRRRGLGLTQNSRARSSLGPDNGPKVVREDELQPRSSLGPDNGPKDDRGSGGEPRVDRADERLGADFYGRQVLEVARDLVGCRLFFAGVGGTIVETEAYDREDPASHSFVGFTDRTSIMFGPPGRAYVYLSYGIHSLLNFVCEPEGEAAAVLVRALEPTRGLEEIRERRPAARSDLDLCSGPGKLTQALGITLAENGDRLDRAPFMLLAPEGDPPEVVTGPRVGITKAIERPWRFSAAGSRYVSRPRPAG